MSNDEARDPDCVPAIDQAGDRDSGSTADVRVHPATAEATSAMVATLTQEFRRWMADEIEELAESVCEPRHKGAPAHTTADIRDLTDQLAHQAEMLGYPQIVTIAQRLKQFNEDGLFEDPDSAAGLDEQISELRAAINS